jgi:hypothetical protein
VFLSTGRADYRFSAEGTLAYWPVLPSSELEWVARDGRRLGAAAAPRPYEIVSLDPDGTRIVASMLDPTTGSQDLWLIELGALAGPLTRVIRRSRQHGA